MLMITGTGRCGTSVLAKFCRAIGYDPGGEWYETVDAGYEHPKVVAINKAMMANLEAGTFRPEDYRDLIRGIQARVVKDPRFLWHPRIISTWHASRNDLSVLLLCRDADEVAASFDRHPEWFTWHGNRTTIYCNFYHSVLKMAELGVPFRVLHFPSFLDQYEGVERELNELGLPVRDAEHVWQDIVDKSKVHHGKTCR
jgi:hypothetical protein